MRTPPPIYEYEPPGEDGGGRHAAWAAFAAAAAYWLWRRWSSGGDEEGPADKDLQRGHRQADDIRTGGVVAFAAALAVLIAAIFGMIALLTSLLEAARPDVVSGDEPYAGYTVIPSRPTLQTDPAVDLKAVREREERVLHGYRWVDREGGLAAIPIERAMALMAESIQAEPGPVDTIRVLTESGYVEKIPAVSDPSAPAWLGRNPEPYTVDPELARILQFVDITDTTRIQRD